MLTRIGDYYIDQPVAEALDLTELEPAMAGRLAGPQGHRLYNGHDVAFAGATWNTTISANHDRIIRIAIQHMSHDKRGIKSQFKETLGYLINELGKCSQHPFLSKKYRWEYAQGNVILSQRSIFGFACINLLLTDYAGLE